jgi:hypothetical protein
MTATPDFPLDGMRRHKLLTAEIAEKLPALRSTDGGAAEALVVCKFFTPDSSWTWYVLEGEPEAEGADWMFFGLVVGHEAEFGYVSLAELATLRGPMGLPVERDCYWTPAPLREVVEGGEWRGSDDQRARVLGVLV